MKLLNREPTPEMIESMHERGATLTGMFQSAYDAAPEVKQEPVAEVVWFDPATLPFPEKPGKIIDGSMAFMDGATVGTKLFAYPPDALAEIAKRDARIAELEQDLQTTADALAEVEQIRLSLENVRLFAARHRKEDWALMILGFCAEAGVVGSALR